MAQEDYSIKEIIQMEACTYVRRNKISLEVMDIVQLIERALKK